MQASDTKELPERARYYQSVIDVDTLKSGQKYKDLKTSFVIFICIDDIFGSGHPKYTFENICVEDGKTKLNDRAFEERQAQHAMEETVHGLGTRKDLRF